MACPSHHRVAWDKSLLSLGPCSSLKNEAGDKAGVRASDFSQARLLSQRGAGPGMVRLPAQMARLSQQNPGHFERCPIVKFPSPHSPPPLGRPPPHTHTRPCPHHLSLWLCSQCCGREFTSHLHTPSHSNSPPWGGWPSLAAWNVPLSGWSWNPLS